MSWNINPSDFTLRIREDVEESRNRIASIALRDLVLRTPVDTGRARGGWNVSVGGIQEIDRGSGQQMGETAISEGLSVIAGADPFAVVYIVNAVPYIGKLNNGSSTQAPNGMTDSVFNNLRVRFG